MKRITIFLLYLVLVNNVIAGEKPVASIRITNTSSVERKDEVVEIKFTQLSAKVSRKPFKLIEKSSGREIPYQLEYKGTDKVQNVLLQVINLRPAQQLTVEVIEGEPAKVAPKTFARYVPERKDDFAWENDKVAFRMYGKALETAPDNAYGIDLWTKRTDKLVIDKWYKDGEYHTDKGEGMDYYQVGLTLGAGDVAPFINDSIWFSKNYHNHKVLDNGPLRSTFQLSYDSWKADGLNVTVTKTISLSAGSQMNRIEVKYTIQGAKEMDVVSGIIKRKDPGTIQLDKTTGIMGYWEPAIGDNGITGVGVVLPERIKEMKDTGNYLLSRFSVQHNIPFVYYNGGAWNKAGKIKTAAEWFKYLSDYKYGLDNPLKIEVL